MDNGIFKPTTARRKEESSPPCWPLFINQIFALNSLDWWLDEHGAKQKISRAAKNGLTAFPVSIPITGVPNLVNRVPNSVKAVLKSVKVALNSVHADRNSGGEGWRFGDGASGSDGAAPSPGDDTQGTNDKTLRAVAPSNGKDRER
uniref:Uncharacterized protein n=1 Tax=Candidatus Kentrum sp. UNK TaxID=2126344 RepID=A0A451AN82_9GAMM|nr:MAG: hypothetical protein BECKUNK1418G_GA0071005_114312 [Candidatus Kentron sp. UNK]VFK71930.1 MAG: hypothetical protein BECKUNK1418H_GA0071006_108719 [Candidatus Kentron sp. UNK]